MNAEERELFISDGIEDLRSITVFAEILCEYTAGRGIKSNKELARMLDVSDATISYWKRAEKLPEPAMIFHLAQTLNLTAGERENLLFARAVQQIINDIVEYVSVAKNHGYGDTELQIAKEIVGPLLSALGHADTE